MVYPLVYKKLPIEWDGQIWQQKCEAFHIRHLFLGIKLTEFDSGFSVLVDRNNKSLVRDYKLKPEYDSLVIIFRAEYYYVFRELSNSSLVLANNNELPAILPNNKDLIDNVFKISERITTAYYYIWKWNENHFKFFVLMTAEDNKKYSVLLYDTVSPLVSPAINATGVLGIGNYKATDFKGLITLNVPYYATGNMFIWILPRNNGLSIEEESVWELLDCDFFDEDYKLIVDNIKSKREPTSAPTDIIPTEQTPSPSPSNSWISLVVLTVIFIIIGVIVFYPVLAFRGLKKDKDEMLSTHFQSNI